MSKTLRQDRGVATLPRRNGSALRTAFLSCVSALVIAVASAAPSFSQSDDSLSQLAQSDPNAQLLLQADQLIYDNDNQTITALGGVRIDYDGTRLIADRIVYRQDSARLIAVGNVEILQPDGTRTFAEEIDITDDFRDGFVNSLRVVTSDDTRFAAESAIREQGNITTFNNGIYTACNTCPGHEGRPPLWQIKAQKVIWDGQEKTIRFEKSQFEFLGVPLAYLPVFTTADPSVKRKTGFLAPNFRFSEETGFGLRVPYFINLAPNRDITLAGTGYTRQGFLAEAEYRHRFENGTFTLKTAGIHQLSPDAFDSDEIDSTVRNRGMIGTTGRFDLNSRWTFGWRGMIQSDQNFSRTYEIEGYDSSTFVNQVYLNGLGRRSYFDARLAHYNVQSATSDSASKQQGIVLPSIDYNYVVDRAVAGGELSYDVNARGIVRRETDTRFNNTVSNFGTPGVDADSWRVTTQAEWKRTFIAPGGLVITPILHAQADGIVVDNRTDGATALSATGATLDGNGGFRGMVTAGLELRYPILFSTSSSTHVLEPVAQIFARPDEMLAGVLPNEDVQSLVFDASSLFKRDKFSGYDRTEGGTRANIGLRYTGTFDNGWGIGAIVGQSFHLAGTNSYSLADPANTGADSGLETDRSDIVAGINLTSGAGFGVNFGGRFDERTFEVQRAEANASLITGPVSLSAGYAFIGAQETYGFVNDRHEVSTSARYMFDDNWAVFGSATYDIKNSFLDKYGVGVSYTCDCFNVRVSYTEDRVNEDAIERKYQLYISLRTLGDFGVDSDEFSAQ